MQATMAEGQRMRGVPDILAQPAGILSASPAANPLFADWNHAYLWYCTSDSHLGARSSLQPYKIQISATFPRI